MRLIDADEVIKYYNEEFPSLDNGVHWSRNDIIMNLHNIPTVQAIPIERINNWLNTGRNAKYFIPMMELIKEWEKENEID